MNWLIRKIAKLVAGRGQEIVEQKDNEFHVQGKTPRGVMEQKFTADGSEWTVRRCHPYTSLVHVRTSLRSSTISSLAKTRGVQPYGKGSLWSYKQEVGNHPGQPSA